MKLGKTHCVDIIEGFKQVDDIDLIVTSPPYNLKINYSDNADDMPYEQYLEWVREWLQGAYNSLKNGGRIAINVPLETNLGGKRFISADYINILQDIGYIRMAYIIWDKRNLTSRTAWGSWMMPSCPVVNNPMECILVFAKGSRKRKGDKVDIDITRQEFIDYTLGIWEMSPAKKSKVGHPAPFPDELPYRCMKLYTYQNDLIVDPFSGSGTTQRVANKLNRNFIGFDISQTYCDMANKND